MRAAEAWIAWRLLFSRRSLFGGSAPLAFAGLVLGVASLVAAMAVVSGFEVTLRESMSDVAGHVTVARRKADAETAAELEARIRRLEPGLVAATPFLRAQGLLAHGGRIQGVFLQGVSRESRDKVLHLDSRLQSGSLSLAPVDGLPVALVGKGIAKQHGLNPGDRVRIVVPVADTIDPERFSRKVGEFVVGGVVDLGKFEWNERFMLTDLDPLRALASVGEDGYNGLLLRFADPESARGAGFRLSQALGFAYGVSDWREANENLFEAVRLERVVIFFVIYIIVVVAAFNVASTLFVNVIRRTDEIALLKALGLSRRSLLRVFSAQGVLFGAAGLVAGTVLGWILCVGFTELQAHYQLMSGSVYKVEGIRANIRVQDWAAIAVATLGICFAAALAPAWRGARLSPVEGLRNE